MTIAHDCERDRAKNKGGYRLVKAELIEAKHILPELGDVGEGVLNEALDLLERAARCRDIAEDYHPDLAASLLDLAESLEARAHRLQPSMSQRVFTGRTNFVAA